MLSPKTPGSTRMYTHHVRRSSLPPFDFALQSPASGGPKDAICLSSLADINHSSTTQATVPSKEHLSHRDACPVILASQ